MRPCKRTSPACGGGGSRTRPTMENHRRPVFHRCAHVRIRAGRRLFFSTGAPLPCKVCYPAAWLSLVLFALRDKACVPVAGALLLSAGGRCRRSSARLSAPNVPLRAGARRLHPLFPAVGRILPQTLAAAAVVGAGLLLFLFAGIVPAWRRPSNGRASHSTAR